MLKQLLMLMLFSTTEPMATIPLTITDTTLWDDKQCEMPTEQRLFCPISSPRVQILQRRQLYLENKDRCNQNEKMYATLALFKIGS